MAEPKKSSHFVSVLLSAVFEWLLLLLLLFDAVVQYFGTKFAHTYKLQTPCLLCSRIDYILGKAKPGFLGDLICEPHRLETSFLAYCHSHRKLSVAFEMCDGCLLSFTKEKKFDPAVYKFLVAEEWSVLEDRDNGPCGRGTPRHFASKEFGDSSLSCSCCSQKFRNPTRTMEFLEFRLFRTRSLLERDFSVQSSRQSDFFDKESEGSIRREKRDEEEDDKKDNASSVAPSTTEIHHLGFGFSENPEAEVNSNVGRTKPKQLYAESSNATVGSLALDRIPANSLASETVPKPVPFVRDLGLKGSLLSPKFAEIVSRRCVNRSIEDIKLVQSHIHSYRMNDLHRNDAYSSPRIFNRQREDTRTFSDATSPPPIQNSENGFQSERTESIGESSEGGGFVGNLGEKAFEHLRRQVELDRESMTILYKELEEERNASAIAANQAMAMINRLQEEKAAMQMEALHYLRMMEEQTEYDQEALQRANEMLSEREKQVQDLEAELESVRTRRFFKEEAAGEELPSFRDSSRKAHESPPEDAPKGPNDEEKDYIMESLKSLGKKLHTLSNGKVCLEEDDEEIEGGAGGSDGGDGLIAFATELSCLNDRLKVLAESS